MYELQLSSRKWGMHWKEKGMLPSFKYILIHDIIEHIYNKTMIIWSENETNVNA